MEIARHWRLQKVRHSLIGEIGEDEKPHFPPGKRWPKITPELIFFPRQLPRLPDKEVIDNVVVGNHYNY